MKHSIENGITALTISGLVNSLSSQKKSKLTRAAEQEQQHIVGTEENETWVNMQLWNLGRHAISRRLGGGARRSDNESWS